MIRLLLVEDLLIMHWFARCVRTMRFNGSDFAILRNFDLGCADHFASFFQRCLKAIRPVRLPAMVSAPVGMEPEMG